MMNKRWISMLLSVMMLLGLSGPAFAEGEPAPPPVEAADTAGLSEADIGVPGIGAEHTEEAVGPEAPPAIEEPGPAVECGAAATEPPQESGTDDAAVEETVSEDVPAEASFTEEQQAGVTNAYASGGLTVDIAGPMEQITWLSFDAPGGGMYDNGYLYKPSMGLCRFELWDDQGNGEYIKEADALPARFSVYPGTEITIQTKPEYDVTVSAGEILRDTFFLGDLTDGTCGVSERIVNIMAPESGSLTLTIAPAAKALPRQVPYTEYGIDLDSGFRCSLEQDTACYGMCVFESEDPDGTQHGKIYTGVTLCFELAPGWTVEVLKGGQVTRVGGFNYPTGYTDSVGVDIRVDDDATEFVYAIVKQGEHFQVPEQSGTPEETSENAPAAVSYSVPAADAPYASGGVAVNIDGPMDQLNSLSFYAPGGEKYDNPYFYHPQKGLCRFVPSDDQGNGEDVKEGDSLPGQFCVYPGTELIVLMKPDYDISISAGTVERNTFYLDHSSEDLGIDERLVNITAPESGSMTITIAPAAKALPRSIPLTMYGGPLQGDGFESANVGDETSFGQWSYTDPDEYGTEHGTIYTGTKLCYELKAGYTIEVLKGGRVTRVGGYCYPTTSTDCVGVDIQVDDDATEFVYAIVRQGEHFDPGDYTTPVDLNKFGHGSSDTSDAPFQDVAADSWYAGDVERAYVLGVIQGTEDKVFRPNAAVTRGQTVTMLYRAEGSPSSGSGAFSDISDAETASAASWAAGQGIVKGVGGGAFDPGSSLTREQFVTVLYRLAGSPDAGKDVLSQFKDGAETSSYAVSAMNWALNNGVLSGYGDGIIQPRGVATRAEVCALIMRFTGA